MTAVPWRAVAAGVLAAVALLSAAQTWARLTAQARPDVVLRLLPYSEPALARASDRAFADGSALEELQALGARLARRAPLAEAPLIFAGLAAAEAGDRDRAIAAMRAAVHRDPRNRVARVRLAEWAIDDGRFGEAIDHLAVLRNIDRGNDAVYLDTLAAIAVIPASRQAVLDRLDPWPSWGGGLVTRLSRQSSDLEFLFQLSVMGPEGARRRFLQRLARNADYDRAYLAWLQFVPEAERVALRWPYNAQFAARGVPPPFNWNVRSQQAEILPDGGLHATFLGRENRDFVEQIMLLTPGAYVFEAVMEGQAPEGGGTLVWAMQCAGERRDIGAAGAGQISEEPIAVGFEFTVPADGCPAQRIELRGEPGEYPRISRSITHEVRIRRLNAAESE